MKLILQLLLPLLIIGGAYLGIKKIASLKTPPKNRKPNIAIPIVEPKEFIRKNHQGSVSTFGVVEAFDTATISSQVTGKVIRLDPNFRMGNTIEKGAIIAEIDQADFKATLSQTEAAVSTAERILAEEQINAKQAIDDWIESGRNIKDASDFYLRKPQIKAAEANLASAQENVAKAQIDLERTIIKSPFTGVVTSDNISIGRHITPQITIGELMDLNKAEIILSLTPSQMEQVDLKSFPFEITLTDPQQPGLSWKAMVTRRSPVIDRNNQVHQMIAELDDPYQKSKPLPVGTFVTAELPGKIVENTFAIPDSALINDSFVWTVRESKLVKQEVTRKKSQGGIAFLSIDNQSLDKLAVIISPLTSFKNDMEVSLKEDSSEAKSEKGQGKKGNASKEGNP